MWGFALAEKWEILFLVFHKNAFKFSCERRIGFTAKYMENQSPFFVRLYFSNLIGSWYLYFFIEITTSTFLKLSSINLLTFSIHSLRSLRSTHPRQNGGVNLKRVCCTTQPLSNRSKTKTKIISWFLSTLNWKPL